MSKQNYINNLTEHLFRHESGKMVSVLTKIFGTHQLETAEDVVQQTFMEAINVWKLKGVPDNPSAWLFKVAENKVKDILRRDRHSVNFDFKDDERALPASGFSAVPDFENLFKEELVNDDFLRMMFACCHPGISEENQIIIILKILCGFSTAEIAKAFITSEETISKRLYRAKEFFRSEKIKLEIPSVDELKFRVNAVLSSIYLLFNEGYNSTKSENLIRKELIDEAIILCKLLSQNKHTQLPEVFALMALMCFHSARSRSRLTFEGEIILLKSQDRNNWDRNLIEEGNRYLNIAAFGNEVSPYHIEAAIAYVHCTSESFDKTNWKQILMLYEWLCKISPSPVTEMNKTVALMQVYGPGKALEVLEQIEGRKKLESYYLFHALLGEIFSQLNQNEKAQHHFETAIRLNHSEIEKKILKNKIALLLS